MGTLCMDGTYFNLNDANDLIALAIILLIFVPYWKIGVFIGALILLAYLSM